MITSTVSFSTCPRSSLRFRAERARRKTPRAPWCAVTQIVAASSLTCGGALCANCHLHFPKKTVTSGCAKGQRRRRRRSRRKRRLPMKTFTRRGWSPRGNRAGENEGIVAAEKAAKAASAAKVAAAPPNRGAGAIAPPPCLANKPRRSPSATSPRAHTRLADSSLQAKKSSL